jgi:hypothetical protein
MSLAFEWFESEAMVKVARLDRLHKKKYGAPVKKQFDYGVPLILSAGNKAEEGRPKIDSMPKVVQDTDDPIINVGAAGHDGKRAAFSQYGDYLTIYAPGTEIETMTKEDKKATDNPKQEGTSFGKLYIHTLLRRLALTKLQTAAPQVAGMLVTYMALSTRPWDDSQKGVDRVKEIYKYVVSDKSSWERSQGTGIRMI